ncbi:Uma2 family endonuclease [Litoribacter ruber]|uniref:Uma2 family endonuclease n=1 Tax=Litoribacter ruber TaxID=702568 RepID=UPI001BDA685C|nr:Uma2 family endonuclease [Litoribacter ruber]MBT0812777.1 Uma2 family endonuclease [Litoribacter ruber]
MKTDDTKDRLEEPFSEYGRYSYADYLSWEIEEMVEIIKGKVFRNTAAPSRKHQELSLRLSTWLYAFLEKSSCKVYGAPFDVRLPGRSKEDKDIFTVVQPDICVVCDLSKLDDAGCVGAPDLVVEILSPGGNQKDLKFKYDVYLESGVREYWVVHPEEQTLLVYTLRDRDYVASRLFVAGDIVNSTVVEGFELDVEGLFKVLE